MKTRKEGLCFLICLFGMLFCCACGRQEEDLGEEYREGTDYQVFFGRDSMPCIQKGGDGYYFLVSDHLYYYNTAMEQAIPVCGKADCSHSGEDCHAYMGPFVSEINYYDHKLYYIASERKEAEGVEGYFLWSVSEDGSQREKVAQILTIEEEDDGVMFELCVHRGYAYFSAVKGQGGDKKSKASVQKINVEGTPVCTDVVSYEGYSAGIAGLTAYGNTLIVEGEYADAPYANAPVHTDFIDIRDGSRKQDVLYDPAKNFTYRIDLVCKQGNEVIYSDKGKFFSLDVKSGEAKPLTQYETAYGCLSSMEGDYWYACNWEECREKNKYEDYGIDVLDKNGKKIADIPLKEEMEWRFGDESYAFAIGFSEGNYMVYMLEKKPLLSGGAEWKQVLTVFGDGADEEEDADEGSYEDGSEEDFME